MISKNVDIVNKLGLHARAAAKFVTLASTFECEVTLAKCSREVNAKSIMGVMMLAAGKGTSVTLTTTGCDEKEASQQLIELINNRFGESE